MKKTVVLDFDGVLHSYTSGWQGETAIPDPPVNGARIAVDHLREHYRVVVCSTRCAQGDGLWAVTRWLQLHGIVVDEVSAIKPPAVCYVDDRAIRFEGDWSATVAEIEQRYPAVVSAAE